ncbi:MAG: sodium/proton-translocating pyrophosphatase, partial [Clostridia bacterium]|nr:sodium/proton-translocating pyrophosphatase [Clostridia bacterium]
MLIMTFAGSLLALVFAVVMARRVMAFPEGTERMSRLSAAIRSGANAYLKRQYRVVAVFFGVMFAVLSVMALLKFLTPYVPFAFLTGGFFSGL